MPTPFHLDHHLQSHIVRQLMAHGEQNFSALRPAEIENSLFMYHTRKLIARGIIEKTENGFQLTARGARWANKTGAHLHTQQLPRPMVQLLVLQNGQVLVSERADHLATHLNRYMLPGTLHRFGETSQQAAERAAAKFGLTLTSRCIGHTETILPEQQHHSIIDIYAAMTPSTDYTYTDDLFAVYFKPIDEVLAVSSAEEANASLPKILRHYLANHVSRL